MAWQHSCRYHYCWSQFTSVLWMKVPFLQPSCFSTSQSVPVTIKLASYLSLLWSSVQNMLAIRKRYRTVMQRNYIRMYIKFLLKFNAVHVAGLHSKTIKFYVIGKYDNVNEKSQNQ